MIDVSVLMGGLSHERSISIKTGNEVFKNLNKKKYNVNSVLVDNKGEIIDKVKYSDLIFIALHGEYGEDGTVQGLLDSYNLKYSGSGVLSSSVCMSKLITKYLLKGRDFNVPMCLIIDNKYDIKNLKILKYPVVIKPDDSGSSIGVNLAKNEIELKYFVNETLKISKKVIIEEFINGEEYTIPIIDKVVYPIMHIEKKEQIFNFDLKYSRNGKGYKSFNINNKIKEEIKKIGLEVYNILNCEVYARIDVIVSNNKIYILEVNTLPGLTKESLLPKSLEKAGISYNDMLDLIIEKSLKKYN
jgi:D-alanine-D-alanine ligase